jgi:hypothetical protein
LQKGEGVSLMVLDFALANYRWLHFLFKAGKGCDGYFTNEEVYEQLINACNIIEATYPNNNHVFAFNNATTHTKCPDDALSAMKMLKKHH